MRKKSHITIAKYLIDHIDADVLQHHRKSFMFGSVLPDCMPSFLTRKHTIEDTFFILKKEIRKLTEDYDVTQGEDLYFCRHLGIIIHYVADYFTLPHNKIFDGSLKDHIKYEKELKIALKGYLGNETIEFAPFNKPYHSVDEICSVIIMMHEIYIEAKKEIIKDCQFILELCHYVVEAILSFILMKVGYTSPVY